MQTFRNLDKHLGLVPAQMAQQLSAIDIGRGRQEAFRHQHPALLESLRHVAMIQSVEASNAIEAITAPTERVIELVEQKTTPANRSEQEIAGYRAVLDTIHSKPPFASPPPRLTRRPHVPDDQPIRDGERARQARRSPENATLSGD